MIHVPYALATNASFAKLLTDAKALCSEHRAKSTPWAVITFGVQEQDWQTFMQEFDVAGELKAAAHYCPRAQEGAKFLVKGSTAQYIPFVLIFMLCNA